MTDLTEDPDFIQIYRSGDREWPGYKTPNDQNASLPLLISEIFRLIPFIGSEYVKFHPKNMPEVTIDKVEIIGIVTEKIEMKQYTSYIVDDSTGAISVLCKPHKPIEEVSKESSGNDSSVPIKTKSKLKSRHGLAAGEPYGLAPGAPYSYKRYIRDLWHRARDGEPLLDTIEMYDYVHVMGFCAMNFRNQKNVDELTDEDIELGRLFFFGIKTRRISEKEHNTMMKSLITKVAALRYLKPDISGNVV